MLPYKPYKLYKPYLPYDRFFPLPDSTLLLIRHKVSRIFTLEKIMMFLLMIKFAICTLVKWIYRRKKPCMPQK